MADSAPRASTAQEALLAELLGDVGRLHDEVKALPAAMSAAEQRLTATVAALTGASDQYRMAITAFNDEAKQELTEYLERKAGQIAAKTIEEQRAAMQEAARFAFRSEASHKAASLGLELGHAAKEIRQARWSRMVEHAFTALVTSIFTSGLVYGIFKYH